MITKYAWLSLAVISGKLDIRPAAFMYPMRRLCTPGFEGSVSLTAIQEMLSVATMKIIARQKGNRRWDLPHEFPLMDSQGILVMCDRRRLPDRRKTPGDLDDLIAILSRISTGQTD